MILVDTFIWIDHLRIGNARLGTLLTDGEVVCHPFIIGELACGTLRNRAEVLTLWSALPQCPVAEPEEAMAFLETHRLFGSGPGWVDVNLLASAMLAKAAFWTLDVKLAAAARRLHISAG